MAKPIEEWENEIKTYHLKSLLHLNNAISAVGLILESIRKAQAALEECRRELFNDRAN